MAKKSGTGLDVLPKIAELLLESLRNQRELLQQLMRADSNVVNAIVQEMQTQARQRAKERRRPQRESTSDGDPLYCSFCGKRQHEVKKLVAGTQAYICNECILLCVDVCREE